MSEVKDLRFGDLGVRLVAARGMWSQSRIFLGAAAGSSEPFAGVLQAPGQSYLNIGSCLHSMITSAKWFGSPPDPYQVTRDVWCLYHVRSRSTPACNR